MIALSHLPFLVHFVSFLLGTNLTPSCLIFPNAVIIRWKCLLPKAHIRQNIFVSVGSRVNLEMVLLLFPKLRITSPAVWKPMGDQHLILSSCRVKQNNLQIQNDQDSIYLEIHSRWHRDFLRPWDFPRALEIYLEISWSSGMYNPIHPSSRQRTDTIL